LAHLAECLSADIIADLARYPDLAVIARLTMQVRIFGAVG
jgi:TolB-like protein